MAINDHNRPISQAKRVQKPSVCAAISKQQRALDARF